MNIALFGGAFNPPHIGHILIARQILDFAGVDEVWWVPAYAHSFHKPMVDVSHRRAMTHLLRVPKTHVCEVEIEHRLNGQTIELLPLLPSEHSYVFIIGSDQLPSFHLWGKWRELLEKMPFLVFPRLGYSNEPLYPGMRMVNDASLVVSNISSTKVRQRIARGYTIDDFVPESVSRYIKTHGLYQK